MWVICIIIIKKEKRRKKWEDARKMFIWYNDKPVWLINCERCGEASSCSPSTSSVSFNVPSRLMPCSWENKIYNFESKIIFNEYYFIAIFWLPNINIKLHILDLNLSNLYITHINYNEDLNEKGLENKTYI